VDLTGYAWSGDTPVSVAIQIFAEAREGAEPIRVVSLGELPASRERALVTTTVSGLECGHPYNWRLLAEAGYGKSLGGREPFMIACPRPPEVITSPASETVTEGESASFEAAASGQPEPSVAWQVSRDGGGTWESIVGATSDTFGLAATTLAESGDAYRAVFTNSVGVTATSAAVLTVNPRTGIVGGNPFVPVTQGGLGAPPGSGKVSLLSKRLRAKRNGVISMLARCPSGGPSCRGSLTLQLLRPTHTAPRRKRHFVRLARAVFSVRPGATEAITLRLARGGVELLGRRHSVRVRAVLVTDGAGSSAYDVLLSLAR
jgi:hypothetical protein